MDRTQSPTGMLPSFSLEVDPRTREQRALDNDAAQRSPEANIMDSNYQQQIEPPKSKIRVNMENVRELLGIEQSGVEMFTTEQLFTAAASGDVMMLDGLHQYLHQSQRKLSDSTYASQGKNVLMKALLNLRDGTNSTVDYLLEISDRMGDVKVFVNAACTDAYYQGHTSLHISIERRSLQYVKLLVSKGADVHAAAVGKFFQQQKGPSFYFGELPLCLAACTNQPDVVNYLLENEHQPARVQEQDSHGNTVLHALVLVADNSPENTQFTVAMYDHILAAAARLHPKVALEDIRNLRGLTPVMLAAATGKIHLFKHMLHREFPSGPTKHLSRKFTEWTYGPVRGALYDLQYLDSFQEQSVLEILVYGCDIPNRHEMLTIEPLSKLLDEKWSKVTRYIFSLYSLAYLVYLLAFSFISYNKKGDKPPFPIEATTEGYVYVSAQLFTTLSSVFFLIRGILEIKRKGLKLHALLIDGYFELLFLLQAVSFLVAVGLYLWGCEQYLGFLVGSLALSWVNLLYYFRANKHLGVYSVMIQKMILGDIMRFLFVYIVFLVGFSAAVVSLLKEPHISNTTGTASISNIIGTTNVSNITGKNRSLFVSMESKGPEECQKPTFKNIPYTTLELFKFTLGIGDLEFTEHYHYKEVFYVLLITYIILTYILLLNMLIALMSRTVEKITLESTSIWKLQRAITILDLQRGLPGCLRSRLQSGERMNLGSSTFGEDLRWCFRVEEVNWNQWKSDLGIIREDPGWGRGNPYTSHNATETGGHWRSFVREVSRRPSRNTQPRHPQSTEMRPLTNPV